MKMTSKKRLKCYYLAIHFNVSELSKSTFGEVGKWVKTTMSQKCSLEIDSHLQFKRTNNEQLPRGN